MEDAGNIIAQEACTRTKKTIHVYTFNNKLFEMKTACQSELPLLRESSNYAARQREQ